MQKELEELQPQLKVAAEENDKMMIIIDKANDLYLYSYT